MPNWNNSWTNTWVGGAQPPAPASGPKMPNWLTGNYEMGGGTYASPATATDNAPMSATGRVQARELASLFGDYGRNALGKTALSTGAALAAGFAPTAGDVIGRMVGHLAAPSSMAGLVGNVAAKAAGFSKPVGKVGTVARAINPVATLGLGLMSPLAALGYTVVSPFAQDALGDAFDARQDEAYRDSLEDAHGYLGGRAAARDFDAMAAVGGFETLGRMAGAYGYGPSDLARGMSNRDATKAMRGENPSRQSTYGSGFGRTVGGPVGGARAVDRSYGPSMGGFAGLGIGNPASYGGRGDSGGRDRGGFGDNDGNSDTAGNAGYGR